MEIEAEMISPSAAFAVFLALAGSAAAPDPAPR
jgi:hypothetical protein